MLAPLLRRIFNRYSRYLETIIIRLKPRPNHITLLSIPISIIAFIAIIKRYYLSAAVFIFLSSILDNIDGLTARILIRKSRFGDYLDSLADRYREIIFYIGFALAGYPLESCWAISGSLLISFSKARTAMCISIDDHDWPGIGDMADRITLLIIGLILVNIKVRIFNHDAISIVLFFVGLISHIGTLQRIFYAKKLMKTSEN